MSCKSSPVCLVLDATAPYYRLGANNIASEGAVALAEALKVNSTVTELK
jgi:hypothetical protein